jgi:hypothetical protein
LTRGVDLRRGVIVINPLVGGLHESWSIRWLGPPKTRASARTIALPPFPIALPREHLFTAHRQSRTFGCRRHDRPARRTQALARLAAQHDEITRVPAAATSASRVSRLPRRTATIGFPAANAWATTPGSYRAAALSSCHQ